MDLDSQILLLVKIQANKVLENVKTELAQFLLKAISLRKSDLREYFLAKTNNLANTLVGDFDWTVKVSVSNIQDRLNRVWSEFQPNLFLIAQHE